jgi:hypothetical protein
MADAQFIELEALSDAARSATLEAWRTTGMQIGKTGLPDANAEWGQPMKLWRTSVPPGPHPLATGFQEREAAQKIAGAWMQAAAAWDALTAGVHPMVTGMDDEEWARHDLISEDEICRAHPDSSRCRAR